ncbi:MAG: hypothetical protein CMN77_20360, partial [Spirochaetaceae bacterium]|nr:hypothetical protein [Spirochaetaceae bacterium]
GGGGGRIAPLGHLAMKFCSQGSVRLMDEFKRLCEPVGPVKVAGPAHITQGRFVNRIPFAPLFAL